MTDPRAQHFLASVRALAPEIRDRAREAEETWSLPADLARKMARVGLFRTGAPQAVGGLECAPRVFLEAIEIVSQADASAGWCAMIGATSSLNAGYLPEGVASDIFGGAETITGGVFAPTGRAARDGDCFVLDGRWQWASGSAHCDWLGGGAFVMENGAIATNAKGAPDQRMFLFPARAVERLDTWRVSGLAGTGSAEIVARGLRVPATHVVDVMTQKPVAAGALYAFPIFGLLALGVASVLIGNAQGALDELVALAGGKTPQGARKPLAERATAQALLAEETAALRAARAFLHAAVDEAWSRALDGGALDVPLRANLRLAATHGARAAARVTRAMFELGGGSSVFLSNPLQRRLRDAEVGMQHMMVAAPTYELTGRALMGLPINPAQL